jgi:hypothetical protein
MSSQILGVCRNVHGKNTNICVNFYTSNYSQMLNGFDLSLFVDKEELHENLKYFAPNGDNYQIDEHGLLTDAQTEKVGMEQDARHDLENTNEMVSFCAHLRLKLINLLTKGPMSRKVQQSSTNFVRY